MGNHLNVTTSDDANYHARERKAAKKAARDRGTDYLGKGVEDDETPRVVGSAAEDFGLQLGQEASAELIETLLTKHCDPRTGEYLLEQAPSNFAGPGVLHAREAAKRGVALPEDLTPGALEKRVAQARFKKEKQAIEREAIAGIKGLVVKEQFQAIHKAAKAAQRKNVAYYDLTNSLDKTITLILTSAKAEGDHKLAREISDIRLDLGHYQTGLVEKLVGSRMGSDGVRHVDVPGVIGVNFLHGESREGDPDAHGHVAIANFGRCEDGKFRKLDSAGLIKRHKSLIAALSTRFVVERMGDLGFEMRYDEKSKDWVAACVDRADADVFSQASRAIKRRAEQWRKEYKRLTGKEPSAKDLDAATDRLNLRYRKRKGAVDLGPDKIESYSDRLLAERGKKLGHVYAAAKAARAAFRAPKHVDFDQNAVIAEAIKDIGRKNRTAFKAGELAMALHRHMPVFYQGTQYGHQMLMDTLASAIELSPELVCLAAPDPLADMPAGLRRTSDNESVYVASGREFYAHVDTLTDEQRLLTLAYDKSAPGLRSERARELVESSTLHPSQRDVAFSLLTSQRTCETLVGPAGTGKTYTIARVAEWWTAELGLPVVGLTLSQPAANEMTRAGFKRAFNLERARWAWMRLEEGDPKPGDENYAITAGTLVFADEASMTSTKDLHELGELVRSLGGKLVPVGDHKQLAAIELGGGFQMLAEHRGLQRDGGVLELGEVTRFADPAQGVASLGLRDGDPDSLDYYAEQGWIVGGKAEDMAAQVVDHYVLRLLQGHDVRAVVFTEAQKQDLDVRIRQVLLDMGLVDNDVTTTLSDGTIAGRGDLIQVRRNDRHAKDPTGHEVTNRDIMRVDKVLDGGDLLVRRRLAPKLYTRPFVLSGDYLAEHGTGGYASTGHAVEGQTVDYCYTLADDQAYLEWLYVAMTRARYENKGFFITEDVAERHLDDATDALDRTGFDVARTIMGRTGAELSATQRLTQSFEETWGLKRTGAMWLDITVQLTKAENYRLLETAAGERIAGLMADDEAAGAFWMVVAEARDRGYDIQTLLPKIVAERELHSAHSIAKVLHSRVQLHMESHTPGVANVERFDTFVERTPKGTGDLHDAARRVAEHNDRRVAYLGQRAFDDPTEPWMNGLTASQLGPIMAYREQYGAPSAANSLVDPIGRAPSKLHQPERYHAWKRADDALGNLDRDRDASRLSDDELRLRVAEWNAVRADQPVDVEDLLEGATAALVKAGLRELEAIGMMGKDSQHAVRMGERTTEAQQRVDNLVAQDQRRRDWWRSAEAVCIRQEEAAVELQRRHPDQTVDVPKVCGRMSAEGINDLRRQREAMGHAAETARGPSLEF